jgi:hypothetical protein
MKKNEFNQFLNKTAAQRSIATSGTNSCCYRVGPDAPFEQRGWFCNEDIRPGDCYVYSPALPSGTDTAHSSDGTCRANPCRLNERNGSCCSPGVSGYFSDIFPKAGCYDSRFPISTGQLTQYLCEGGGEGTWRPYQYCDKPCIRLDNRIDPRLSPTHPKAENMDI